MIFGATNKPIHRLLKNIKPLRYLYSCWSIAKTKYLWRFPVGKNKGFLKEEVELSPEIKTVGSMLWQTIKIKSPLVIKLCILRTCPVSSAAVEKGVSGRLRSGHRYRVFEKRAEYLMRNCIKGPEPGVCDPRPVDSLFFLRQEYKTYYLLARVHHNLFLTRAPHRRFLSMYNLTTSAVSTEIHL